MVLGQPSDLESLGHYPCKDSCALWGSEQIAYQDYGEKMDQAWQRYLSERTAYYGLEPRWPDSPFWRRRR